MKVTVEVPEILGDTVTFRWSQDAENPFQRRNEFYFRYEGLWLDRFSNELLFEIFLALQLRVFKGYDTEVEIEFPTPLSAQSVRFWKAFRRARRITISPVHDATGYDPWANGPARGPESKTAAVFFGGGKDSMLAACLLSEIYGPDQIVLVQFVVPLQDSVKLERFLEDRQERLMLAPAREHLGLSTQRVWTDFQANFRPAGYHLRPNLELYTVGALPALLHWNVSLSTFTACWMAYPTMYDGSGNPSHRYGGARPESIAAQSRHYRETLRFDHTVGNISLPYNALVTYWLLAERYPNALARIVMCTHGDVDKRWCYNCQKCSMYALLGLSTGVVDPSFDYDHFFRSSRFSERARQYAESDPPKTELGNAGWQPFIFDKRSYIMTCHIIARIDTADIPIELSEEALRNIAVLKSLYGNRLFPEFEQVPQVTFDVQGPVLGPKLAAITAEHLDLIDHLPLPHFAGNIPSTYIFDRKITLAVDELE